MSRGPSVKARPPRTQYGGREGEMKGGAAREEYQVTVAVSPTKKFWNKWMRNPTRNRKNSYAILP